MHPIRRILVTTDFSHYSVAAFEYAFSLADIHNADVHVLHVAEAGSSGQEEAARKCMQNFIVANVDEFQNVVRAVRTGVPHEEIARYAKECEVDLIVIATHGRTGLAHVLMGSVAEKVVRRAAVPVLTVKPAAMLEKLISEDDVREGLHIPRA